MSETTEPTICPSCGQSMGTAYCGHCGEKKLDAHSRSIKHLLIDYIENITSFDGKIWRTVRLLMFRPGHFEYQYHLGNRVNYIKPIALFLIMNFLFVLLSPISDFYVNLFDQLTLQPYSPWINHWYQDLLINSDLNADEYAAQYNQTVKILSRSTIIIQALVFFSSPF